jgi:hypothetical protein
LPRHQNLEERMSADAKWLSDPTQGIRLRVLL